MCIEIFTYVFHFCFNVTWAYMCISVHKCIYFVSRSLFPSWLACDSEQRITQAAWAENYPSDSDSG